MANTTRRDQGSRTHKSKDESSSQYGRAGIRTSRGEVGRGNLADVAQTGGLDERRDSNEMGRDPDARGREGESLDETLGHDLDSDKDIER